MSTVIRHFRRLIDYYADDVHVPSYLAVLHGLGFVRLSTNERGWERRWTSPLSTASRVGQRAYGSCSWISRSRGSSTQ